MDALLGGISFFTGGSCLIAVGYFLYKKDRKWRMALMGFAVSCFFFVVALTMHSPSKPSPAPVITSAAQAKIDAEKAISTLLPFQRLNASLISRYSSVINKISRGQTDAVSGYRELDDIDRMGIQMSLKLESVEISARFKEDKEKISDAAAAISVAAENCKKYLDDHKPSRIKEAQDQFNDAVIYHSEVRASIIKKAQEDGYKIPSDLIPPEIKQ